MKIIKRVIVLLLFALCLMFPTSTPSAMMEQRADILNQEFDAVQCDGSNDFFFAQLTDNVVNDFEPQIHNGMVTWYGWDDDAPDDHEIYLFDGVSVLRLTDNEGHSDSRPRIHDGMVTWQTHDGHDTEIFLYDHSSGITTKVTDNDYDDIFPEIHNGMVTWMRYDGVDYEIILYDGQNEIQLSNNIYDDYDPQIHNGMVTWWCREDTDNEIYLYNGITTLKITDNSLNDQFPDIHNGMVTWVGQDINADMQIFMWDVTGTTQLTSGSVQNSWPKIHNGMVAWLAYESGEPDKLFLYDGAEITLLSGDYSAHNHQIHNGMVVWDSIVDGVSQIFLYDGVETKQFTDSSWDVGVAQIHDGMLTWNGRDASAFPADWEIFFYGPDGTPPVIDHLEDMGYEQGTTGNSLTWFASDAYPDRYSVERNGVEVAAGSWSGEGITIDVDELPCGTYVYECIVYDEAGNSASDTVLLVVYVTSIEPEWVVEPADQFLQYDEKLDYRLMVQATTGIDNWWINDTVHFDLSATYYPFGSTGRITNKTTLAPGEYGVCVIVTDVYGNSLSGAFRVTVTAALELKLSGNFDYLEKEEIYLQFAALLTDRYSGEGVPDVTILLDVYDPDALVVLSGELVEDVQIPGIYRYKSALTIREMNLGKGIYIAYARAVLSQGNELVDMVQFHIDPPADSKPDLMSSAFPMRLGASVVVGSGLAVAAVFWRRRRSRGS